MLDAFSAGEHDRARALHYAMLPVIRAMGRVGGAVFAKTALRLRGIDVGDTRLPLPPATEEQMTAIAGDLAVAGVALDPAARPDALPEPYGQGALGSRTHTDLGAEVAYR
jgi:4-hydroxy-tetrahydrodipicolinate synthase